MWKYTPELYHHGILGQKWGVRRYQNKDGSLTPAGKKHYARDFQYINENYFTRSDFKRRRTSKKLERLGKADNLIKELSKDEKINSAIDKMLTESSKFYRMENFDVDHPGTFKRSEFDAIRKEIDKGDKELSKAFIAYFSDTKLKDIDKQVDDTPVREFLISKMASYKDGEHKRVKDYDLPEEYKVRMAQRRASDAKEMYETAKKRYENGTLSGASLDKIFDVYDAAMMELSEYDKSVTSWRR